MESLLYFIVWGALFFVIMRIGFGAHVVGRGEDNSKTGEPHNKAARWIPPKSDFDPVCDKVVHPEQALSSVYDGHVYYFCGTDCRAAFEATPEHYLSNSHTPPTAAIEASHV